MSHRDPAERLLNLIIALTHARVRMTRAEIRASVEGYTPADPSLSEAAAKQADAAFERMFERDKDDLRRMGVPIRTVTDAAHGDDIGYKIDASDAALKPLDLSAGELAVLGLAAEYWQGATLGADARLALTKVTSSSRHQPKVTLPLAARSTATHDVTGAFIEAIQERCVVTFEYASSRSGPAVRTLEPWHLVVRGGSEYVLGFDRDRGEARTFRLGRVLGGVAMAGQPGAFERPAKIPLGMDDTTSQSGEATVAVRPEAGHSLRTRGKYVRSEDGWDVFTVNYVHPDALRDEVLGLAGAARVLEPRDIAQGVSDHAAAALEVAGG